MAATVARGRGRGRGRGTNLFGSNFKPKEISISQQDIKAAETNFDDADDNDDVNIYFSQENLNTAFKRQTSVDEMVSQIAFDIKKEVKRQNSKEKNNVSTLDEKPKDENFLSENKNIIENRINNLNINSHPRVNGIVPDEEKPKINTSNELKPQYDPVLLQALHAKEFIPFEINNVQKEQTENNFQNNLQTSDVIVPEKSNRDIVMDVLNDTCLSLIDDPGYLDDLLPNIGMHLENFVHEERLLKEVVDYLVDKMLSDGDFRYVGSQISHHIDQNVKFENMKFRNLFYGRCQSEFNEAKKSFDNLKSIVDEKYIENVSLMFGELLCNTKVKNQVNKVFRKVVFDFVDFFLGSNNEYCMKNMVKLLKLVGPELDRERPKDVEIMFDKVRDFYLDNEKSAFLTSTTKDLIWRVYKLHTRDWDRTGSVPPSPTFSHSTRKFSASSLPISTTHRRSSNDRDSPTTPIDWDEYHYGDDAIYDEEQFDPSKYDDVADEEYDAYEEFLRLSGQI